MLPSQVPTPTMAPDCSSVPMWQSGAANTVPTRKKMMLRQDTVNLICLHVQTGGAVKNKSLTQSRTASLILYLSQNTWTALHRNGAVFVTAKSSATSIELRA